jgi:hypothetical protein
MRKEYILENLTPSSIIQSKKKIKELYREFGVVIFPKLLLEDFDFLRYINHLGWIFDEILRRHTSGKIPADFGDKLTLLNKLSPLDGKILTDLGTQPNKFNSFNLLKYSGWLNDLLVELFGEQAVLVTPQAGDTLHFFAPGEAFRRYNLPPHQDYQYLMQSPSQLTCYLGLSNHKADVGGLSFWERSHNLGVLRSNKNNFGSYEVSDYENILSDFESADFFWNPGDFAIFDSLLVHRSIPNYSVESGRVVQIFRFSDVNNDLSRKINYMSTCYERRSIKFEDVYPSLFENN